MSYFLKPGSKSAPGLREDVEHEEGCHTTIVYNPYSGLPLSQQRTNLPIFTYRNNILYMVENKQVVILVGSTGCGKTTQIPQYLHEAGWADQQRVIACTQPRRVAAMNIAARVAEEMHVKLGQEVGYSIRYDDNTDPQKTRIKYLTDGMLLRETMIDPLLSRYSVIMLDEAHERGVCTDILLALLKKILVQRNDLRLIVSSATLDAVLFQNYYALFNASICCIEGRQFPVDIYYLSSPIPDYVLATVDIVVKIHQTQPKGHILCFLTGMSEVEECVSMIRDRCYQTQYTTYNLRALPLYAGLSYEDQLKAFEEVDPNTRKCIVSTNIAEASVTIDKIVYVVDSGFAKFRSFDPYSGIETLLVSPISQASSIQRAGRAGRVQSGQCYRLYTEETFNSLTIQSIPEIQRCNLTPVCLQLKALGIDNIVKFPWFSPPSAESLARSLELLYALEAIDTNCQLTSPLGTILCEIPIEPRLAKMIYMGGNQYNCSEEMLTISAMIQVESLWINPKSTQCQRSRRKFAVKEGDHISYLNIFNAFMNKARSTSWCKDMYLNHRALNKAVQIREQLRAYIKRYNIPLVSSNDATTLRRCIVHGFFSNAAQLQPNGTYKSIRGNQLLKIHPTSVLFGDAPQFVVYHEILLTTEQYMRDITVIEPLWLSELAPQFYEYRGVDKKRKLF